MNEEIKEDLNLLQEINELLATINDDTTSNEEGESND